MNITEIVFDEELEQVNVYYNDEEDEEPVIINIDKLGIAKLLDYDIEYNQYEECIITVGIIDGFNGEHFEIPITILLDEWHPSFEELTKFIELYEAN